MGSFLDQLRHGDLPNAPSPNAVTQSVSSSLTLAAATTGNPALIAASAVSTGINAVVNGPQYLDKVLDLIRNSLPGVSQSYQTARDSKAAAIARNNRTNPFALDTGPIGRVNYTSAPISAMAASGLGANGNRGNAVGSNGASA